jgi:hypothetical protein
MFPNELKTRIWYNIPPDTMMNFMIAISKRCDSCGALAGFCQGERRKEEEVTTGNFGIGLCGGALETSNARSIPARVVRVLAG